MIKKKRETITEIIKLPEGFECEVKGNVVIIRGNNLENKKKFDMRKIKISKKNREMVLEAENATRKEKKLLGTIKAHINNMIRGLEKKFVYKLEICHIHFPMTVTVDEDKKHVVIKNFLGETKPRIAKILPEVEVKVEGNIITVESHDKEAAGQTAANLEKATWIRYRDRKKFQDGIFITEKCGKEI